MGRIKEAHDVPDTLAAVSTVRYIPPFASALIRAGLHQTDASFDHLEHALETRDVHFMFLPIDAKRDPFRPDPRFQSILARCAFSNRNH